MVSFRYSSIMLVFFQPSSVRGWTWASISSLCDAIEGRLRHFLPCWLRPGWQSVISQGKNPSKYSVKAGYWSRAMGRTDIEIRWFSHWAIMTALWPAGRLDDRTSWWLADWVTGQLSGWTAEDRVLDDWVTRHDPRRLGDWLTGHLTGWFADWVMCWLDH